MAPIDESEELLWINETLQGRVQSFSNLIEKYQDRIYTLVVKSIGHNEDAKDITQNIFVNAFSNLSKFRKESSFLTWLYRIAINQIKNYWRSNKQKFVIAESDLKRLSEKGVHRFRELTDLGNVIDSEESRLLFDELITFLPLEQRQLFVLYYAAGYTCPEIAEICKTSASNVKIQLFRGRQFLYNKFWKTFK